MEPALFVISVCMTVLMTIVAVIAFMLCLKNENDMNRGLRDLGAMLLLHMVFAFFQYYFEQEFINETLAKGFGVTADAFYFGVVAAWIKTIAAFDALSHRDKHMRTKYINCVILGYAIAVEFFVIFYSGRHADGSGIYFENEIAEISVLLLNGAFDAFAVIVGAWYVITAFKTKEKGPYRGGELFFSIALTVYMIWVFIFDYSEVRSAETSFWDVVVIDPLFVICAILDIAIIVIFVKKKTLEIGVEPAPLSEEDKIAGFVKTYALTRREEDVLRNVCKGMNNPEIAEKLFISEYTVKRHINNIFRKSGSKNRYELILAVIGSDRRGNG